MTRSDAILRAIADAAEVSLARLRGPQAAREVAWPRQVAMLVLHEAGYSTPQIGRWLGRDHTTVLYGVRMARKRMGQSRQLRKVYVAGCAAAARAFVETSVPVP